MRETLDGEHRKWKSYVSTCKLSSADSFCLFRRIWGPRGGIALKIIEAYGENARKTRKWETLVCIADKFSRLRPDRTKPSCYISVIISKKVLLFRKIYSLAIVTLHSTMSSYSIVIIVVVQIMKSAISQSVFSELNFRRLHDLWHVFKNIYIEYIMDFLIIRMRAITRVENSDAETALNETASSRRDH